MQKLTVNLAWRDGLHGFLEVPTMARLLSLPIGKRILLLGCGSGVALPALVRRCKPKTLVGIDISKCALDEAAALLGKEQVAVGLVHADAHRTPFADGAFDVIVDFGLCYRAGNADRVLQEIARILDPDGILVHETPLAQLLAHPIHSLRHGLPAVGRPNLVPQRNALLWATRRKV